MDIQWIAGSLLQISVPTKIFCYFSMMFDKVSDCSCIVHEIYLKMLLLHCYQLSVEEMIARCSELIEPV